MILAAQRRKKPQLALADFIDGKSQSHRQIFARFSHKKTGKKRAEANKNAERSGRAAVY